MKYKPAVVLCRNIRVARNKPLPCNRYKFKNEEMCDKCKNRLTKKT